MEVGSQFSAGASFTDNQWAITSNKGQESKGWLKKIKYIAVEVYDFIFEEPPFALALILSLVALSISIWGAFFR